MTEFTPVGIEVIAARLETDAALVESGATEEFPPGGHYFWSAFRAEEELYEGRDR